MPNSNSTTENSHRISLRFGDAVLEAGFTSVPNLVLNYYASLGITASEMMFTIHIWQHWWTEKDPYPSLKRIAEKMDASQRQVRRYVESLKNKGYLIVRERYIAELGQLTNEYDFSPLIQAVVAKASDQKNTPRSKISSEEYEEKEDSDQKDIYLSKIRNAKSDEFDYVNSEGSTAKAVEGSRLTQNDEVRHSQIHGTAKNRNVEKIESGKNNAPAHNRTSAPPPSPAEPQRKGGLAHIGQTLQGRLPVTTPTVDDTAAREAIGSYIRDIAAKLHDEAPLKSSTSRAFNLYQQAGVDLNAFFNLLYDAEKEANRRSATIKKLTAQGFKNRMAYFVAVLEDKLGLREKFQPSGPQSP